MAQEALLVYDPEVTEAFSLNPNPTGVAWSRESTLEEDKVWAITFAIWNSGNLAIKAGDVLAPLNIQVGTASASPEIIWEIRTLGWSRKEVDFSVLDDDIKEVDGVVSIPIEFRIMENEDGARLQLIYSGSGDLPITLRGTIEGNKTNEFLPARTLDKGKLFPVLIFLGGGVLTGLFGGCVAVIVRRRGAPLKQLILPFAGSLGLVVFGVTTLFVSEMTTFAEVLEFIYLLPAGK